LGPDSQLVDLLWALKSTSELRGWKLISIVSFPDWAISLPGRFSFPKFETLLLQDSNFTALKLLLRSVAPGSHRLRVFLIKKCKKNQAKNPKNPISEKSTPCSGVLRSTFLFSEEIA
ncbi:hypothetical protein FRC11_004020, partial [Ceratobasidium sp. 423]